MLNENCETLSEWCEGDENCQVSVFFVTMGPLTMPTEKTVITNECDKVKPFYYTYYTCHLSLSVTLVTYFVGIS